MPGVREAIEQKQWSSVDPQIERVAGALEREASLLREGYQVHPREVRQMGSSGCFSDRSPKSWVQLTGRGEGQAES